MDKVTNNVIINYAQIISIRSSIEIDAPKDNYIEGVQPRECNEENLSLTDENEDNFENCKDDDASLEQVWWHSKPPLVLRQSPTVSTRQVQVTRQRLLPTIKKPSSLVDTLRGKVEENLKQQRR